MRAYRAHKGGWEHATQEMFGFQVLREFLMYFGRIEQEFHELCKPLASRSRRTRLLA